MRFLTRYSGVAHDAIFLQWSVASSIWLTSLLWGDIYVSLLPTFNGTNVKLFGVKQAAPSRREQVGIAASFHNVWVLMIIYLTGHSKRLKPIFVFRGSGSAARVLLHGVDTDMHGRVVTGRQLDDMRLSCILLLKAPA